VSISPYLFQVRNVTMCLVQAAWTTGYICGRSIAKRLEMHHRAMSDNIDGKAFTGQRSEKGNDE